MSAVAVAIGVGAAGVIAGVGGAAISAYSASEAQKAYEKQSELDRQQLQAATEAAQQAQQPFAQAGMGGVNGLQGYQQTGQDALAQQRALAGLDGPQAQQAAIEALKASPGYTQMMDQAQTTLLQNASATGGVRGGDTQGALAQLGPSVLNQLIQQQYANLGGLAGAGQNAASNIGQLGQASASGMASSALQGAGMQSANLQGLGNSNANALLAQGQAWNQGLQNAAGSAAGAFGTYNGYQARLGGK